jgi:hypothetical protein
MPTKLKDLYFINWWLPIVAVLFAIWGIIQQSYSITGVSLIMAIIAYFTIKIIVNVSEKNYKKGYCIWTRQDISEAIHNPGWLVEEPVIYDLEHGQGNYRGYVMINCGPIGNQKPGMREAHIDIYDLETEDNLYRLTFREIDKIVRAEDPNELSQKAFQYACDSIQMEIIKLG